MTANASMCLPTHGAGMTVVFTGEKFNGMVDHFIDIRALSDFEAATRINADGIDILVDMMGWMHGHRIGIVAQQPAPIQINYLGYPGTTGAPFMDYILADRVVIPPEQRRYYSEQVVWLPNCYQANDPQTPMDARYHRRSEYGLPDKGIVFCAFNTDYKIEPSSFASWMRIPPIRARKRDLAVGAHR